MIEGIYGRTMMMCSLGEELDSTLEMETLACLQLFCPMRKDEGGNSKKDWFWFFSDCMPTPHNTKDCELETVGYSDGQFDGWIMDCPKKIEPCF